MVPQSQVWVQLVCAFRYGQEDLDVIGLPFRKDICIQHVQVYPPENGQPANTPTQDALMKKVGEQGHPFTFTPCGVDYELKGYIANKADTPAENVEKKCVQSHIDQTADVLLYSADKYTKCVLNEEFGDSVNGNATFEKEYRVTPSLANSKEKRGLALDGRLKDKDTNLASTATLRPGLNRDVAGILVSYKVKVNLMVSSGGFLGDLTAR
ncbi:hypothetical protein COCON_G00041810 [Conger conger]|uniref:Arrestin-C n=1 Tax=Conger conger TaxID=82655 RepID=A0A9Q1DTR2_CONCO|nr:hypothetical protein COCON_G00041810 [Conger conger]